MATVIDSLLIRLGFDADTSGAASFETGIGRVIKTAGKAAAVIGGVGIAAAGFLGKSLLDTASQFEQFKTQLTTIEGSSEKAQKSLDWIADFAKKTPYELAEVTDAFVKMKSYGLDPIDGNFMESIGNMASGMGKSIDQAVEAVADAVTGENERLKEFGIKSSKDKKSNTITYTYSSNGETITKTVDNDAKAISKGLQEIMDERFSGGMDAMSKTWAGTIANLGDTWQGFLMQIAGAGIFDVMKDGLTSLSDWINNNEEAITNFALAIAEGFKIAIATIVAIYDAVSAAYNWLDENMQAIITTIKAIGVIAGVIGTALVIMYAPAIAGFILMKATGLLSFLILQAAAIASAAATAAAWLIAFAPFLLIGAVIAGVIAALWLIYTNWDVIAAYISAAWGNLVAAVSAWWSGLMDTLSAAIANFIIYMSTTFPTITAVFWAVVETISSLWSGFWSLASAIVTGAISVINSVIDTVTSVFSSVVATISEIWAGLWEGVKSMAGAAIDWVIGKVQALTGLIGGALGSIGKLVGFKMPSFSGASAAMGGGGKGGNTNNTTNTQNIKVNSIAEAIAISKAGTQAQRKSNNGYN